MTTEVNDKEIAELDAMVGFGAKKKQYENTEFEKDAVVPEIWYWCVLARMGRPFVKPNPKKPDQNVTKSAFEFVIMGEADRMNKLIASEFATGKLTTFINVEGWGEKSTMYKLCCAIYGAELYNLDEYEGKAYPTEAANKADADNWISEMGRDIAPSDLIGRYCWVRVSNSTKINERGENEVKSWPQEFKAALEQINFGIGKPGAVNAPKAVQPSVTPGQPLHKPAGVGFGKTNTAPVKPAPKKVELADIEFDDDLEPVPAA